MQKGITYYLLLEEKYYLLLFTYYLKERYYLLLFTWKKILHDKSKNVILNTLYLILQY